MREIKENGKTEEVKGKVKRESYTWTRLRAIQRRRERDREWAADDVCCDAGVNDGEQL